VNICCQSTRGVLEWNIAQVEIDLNNITGLDVHVIGVLNGIERTRAKLSKRQRDSKPFNDINREIRN
jgi:hypothetical protein